MNQTLDRRIPVNIISGPLGVGKTTTVNHLLKQRPADEKWAILVNEYGLVGIDAALMRADGDSTTTDGVEVKEVAGGCICCSAGFMFKVSLLLLLQRKPDRLLIEPTGLAALSGILSTLEEKGIREAVDVRSIVCLLDAARYAHDFEQEKVRDQVEAADVLLATRADLVTQDELTAFQDWGGALFPPKQHVGHIENGIMPLAFLDLVAGRESAIHRGGHTHGTDHTHEESHQSPAIAPDSSVKDIRCDASQPVLRRCHRSSQTSTFGWQCWDGLVFDFQHTTCWLRELMRLPGARRVKAVFRSTEGWWSLNLANDTEDLKLSSYRRDSRMELIVEGELAPDAETLEESFRRCLVEPEKAGTTSP